MYETKKAIATWTTSITVRAQWHRTLAKNAWTVRLEISQYRMVSFLIKCQINSQWCPSPIKSIFVRIQATAEVSYLPQTQRPPNKFHHNNHHPCHFSTRLTNNSHNNKPQASLIKSNTRTAWNIFRNSKRVSFIYTLILFFFLKKHTDILYFPKLFLHPVSL